MCKGPLKAATGYASKAATGLEDRPGPAAPAPAPRPKLEDWQLSAGKSVCDALAKEGLWVRSIQMKHAECLTADEIDINAVRERGLKDVYIDCWTYAHVAIPQTFFQMGEDESGRALALIVDWQKTKDRYVSYSAGDASSNKTPLATARLPEAGKAEKDMSALRGEVAGKEAHNEVRTVQICRSALVGLLWHPILRPRMGLSDGHATWEATRPRFQSFVNALTYKSLDNRRVHVCPGGLPVFRYRIVEAQKTRTMKFEQIDYLLPQLPK